MGRKFGILLVKDEVEVDDRAFGRVNAKAWIKFIFVLVVLAEILPGIKFKIIKIIYKGDFFKAANSEF